MEGKMHLALTIAPLDVQHPAEVVVIVAGVVVVVVGAPVVVVCAPVVVVTVVVVVVTAVVVVAVVVVEVVVVVVVNFDEAVIQVAKGSLGLVFPHTNGDEHS